MINKSLSLLLGIALSLTVMGEETLARPHRIPFNPNPGIHRTIITPNTRIGNGYRRGNSYYRGGGYSRSRERIIIQRDQRGYCGHCGYSDGYNPYRNYRGYGRNSRFNHRHRDYPYYREYYRIR